VAVLAGEGVLRGQGAALVADAATAQRSAPFPTAPGFVERAGNECPCVIRRDGSRAQACAEFYRSMVAHEPLQVGVGRAAADPHGDALAASVIIFDHRTGATAPLEMVAQPSVGTPLAGRKGNVRAIWKGSKTGSGGLNRLYPVCVFQTPHSHVRGERVSGVARGKGLHGILSQNDWQDVSTREHRDELKPISRNNITQVKRVNA
jgi:hypothetical protein